MCNKQIPSLLCMVLATLVATDALYVQHQTGQSSKDNVPDKHSLHVKDAKAHKYIVSGKATFIGGKNAQAAHSGNIKLAGNRQYQGSGIGHKASQTGSSVSGQRAVSNKAATRSSTGEKKHSIAASKKTSSKSGSSSRSLKKKNHKKDYILNDSIHYGFDKNFNQEQIEDGVYKVNKHLDAKQLANHHDRHRKYKTRQGQSDSSSKSLGSQRGIKESSQNAFDGDHSSRIGDFMSKQNNKRQNGAKSSVFGSKFNYRAGGNRFTNKKGDRLGRSQNSSNLKTNKQSAGASRFGQQQHGGSDASGPYGKQSGGITYHGGTRGHHLSTGNGYKSSNANGVGSSRALSNRDSKFRSGAISDFKKNRNSGDNRNGSSFQSVSHDDALKRNRENQNSGKFKNASNRKFADASKFHHNNDSSRQKHVNIEGGENMNKDYKNKVKNKKVSKVFHTSKKVKGDNYERLDFDRKKLEKDRAKDSSFKSANDSKYSNNFRNTNNKAKHNYNSNDNAKQQSKSTGQVGRYQAAKEGNEQKRVQKKFGLQGQGDYSFGNSGQGFHKFDLKQDKYGSGNHASKQQKALLNSDYGNSAFGNRRVFHNDNHKDLNHLSDRNIAPSFASGKITPQNNFLQYNELPQQSKIFHPEHLQPNYRQYYPKKNSYQIHGNPSKTIHSTVFPSRSVSPQRYQPRTLYTQRYKPRGANSQRYQPNRSSAYQQQTGVLQRQPSPISSYNGHPTESSSSVYQPQAENHQRNHRHRLPAAPYFSFPSFGVPSQNGGSSFSSFHNPFETPINHINKEKETTHYVPSERYPKAAHLQETRKLHDGFEQLSVSGVFAERFFSPNMF